MAPVDPPVPRGGLPVTALYTAGVWAWSERPGADRYASVATRRVFGTVEGVLRIAGWFVRNAPSLRHGLVQRHVMLDALVHEALAQGATTVLELAAGLSPRGTAFTATHDVAWTEVDLPEVVSYKAALLARDPQGQAVSARPTLTRLPADLRGADLVDLTGTDGPTMVLAEGLLMYLDDAARRDLLHRIAARLRPAGGWVAFDYVPPADKPPPGWVARLLGAWMRRFTGGEGLAENPTSQADVLDDLRSAGFSEVRTLAPSDAPDAWAVPHLDTRTEQRVFTARMAPEDA